MSTSAPSVDSSRRPLPAEKVAFSIPRPAHLLPFAPPCSAPPPKPSNYLPSLALSTRRTGSWSKHSSVIYSITCLHGLDAALHYICPIFTGTFFSCDHGSIVVVATLPNIYHTLFKSFFFAAFRLQIILGARISVVGKAVLCFSPHGSYAVHFGMRHLRLSSSLSLLYSCLPSASW